MNLTGKQNEERILKLYRNWYPLCERRYNVSDVLPKASEGLIEIHWRFV